MEPLNDEVIMSKAQKKLVALNNVTSWLLEHWKDIPDDLYKKDGDDFVPYDVKMQLVELVREDFTNAITPTHIWLAMKKDICEDEE